MSNVSKRENARMIKRIISHGDNKTKDMNEK